MKPSKGKQDKTRTFGKGKKDDEEETVELSIEEEIRPIEDIEEEEEGQIGQDGQKGKDIFEKDKESEVLLKLKIVRERQSSLEKNYKWMWPLCNKNSELKTFGKPKRSLEQYMTPTADALTIGYIIQSYIEGKSMADLGAGTGMLGITCLLAGAQKVIFYEIDPDAFSLLKRNCQAILDGNEEDESMENQSQEGSSENSSDQEEKLLDINEKIVQEEIEEGKKPQSLKPTNAVISADSYTLINRDLLTPDPDFTFEKVDCVIMNPPFGTSKDEDIDLAFLNAALTMTQGKIFFIHKLARTKSLGEAAKKLGRRQRILWQFYLEIPKLKFDTGDLLDYEKKGKTKEQIKKSNKAGGSKGRSHHKKGRQRLKEDVEFIKCCLVEWSSA